MWKPDREQATRIARLWSALHPVIDEDWREIIVDLRARCEWPVFGREPLLSRCEESWRRVTARVAADDPAWADFLCFPAATPDGLREFGVPAYDFRQLAIHLGKRALLEAPTAYGTRLLFDRVGHMLSHPLDEAEVTPRHPTQFRDAYFEPRVSWCLTALATLCYIGDALPYVDAILGSAFRRPFTITVDGPGRTMAEGINDDEIRDSYQAYTLSMAAFCQEVLPALHRAGRLDYERFRTLIESAPRALPERHLRAAQGDDALRRHPSRDEDEAAVRAYARRFAWDTVRSLDEQARLLLKTWRLRDWEGGRWLVQVCGHIERLGLTTLSASSYDFPDTVLSKLAGIGHVRDDEHAEAVAALRAFAPETLRLVLPHAHVGQPLVLDALDWPRARTLVHLIQDLGARAGAISPSYWPGPPDVVNSPDPEAGVVDRDEVLRAIDEAGDAAAGAILTVFRRAEVRLDNAIMLIEAVRGWNIEAILQKLGRDSQIALKAYGLLPITGGDAEIRERYVELKEAERASEQFGAERSANTRAAARVGLHNLAANAGCRDLFQLEQRMEALLGDEGPAIGTRLVSAPWELELAMDAAEPVVIVRKAGRTLKTVPAGLRGREAYRTLRDRADALRAQAGRVRERLEQSLVEETRFTREDLAELARLDACRPLIETLVWRAPDGCGFYDAEAGSLRDLAGVSLSLDSGATLAHPVHLFADGVLDRWQHALVERGIRQPFKQVFRELYVLTLAERAARTSSSRFAGHVLTSNIVARLVQARAWDVPTVDEVFPVKRFRKAGLRAELHLVGAGRFLGLHETLSTADVLFRRIIGREIVPLDETPQVVFSETMRDVDLFVSVARHSSSPQASSQHSS